MSTVPNLPTLLDYVDHFAECRPDAAAVIDTDEHVTWRQLVLRVDRLAEELTERGIGPGDVIAIRAKPSSDWWAHFLAILRIGAIHQGLNPKYRTPELETLLNDTRPALVVDLEPTGEPLPPIAPSATAGPRRHVPSPDDVVAIIHTSGSSGVPKAAQLTQRGLVRCSAVANRTLLVGDGTAICNFPVNHVACIGDVCTSVLVGGGTIVFQPDFDPHEVLDLIARHRITVWGAIPAMLQLSVASPRWPGADLTSVQRVVWGGNPAPLDLVRELRSRVPALTTAYGLTETTGNVTFTADHDDDETLATTIGRPHPDYEIALRHDSSDVADGEPGEILVRGDFLMAGYLSRPDATAETIDANGWLHTGDLATRRPDGTLTLIGRRSDMFKSGGYNVYPREIETALEDHDHVVAAAVVGVPDPLYTEVGAAFAVVDDAAADPVVLRAHLSERLANYKVPKTITIIDEMPLLPVGKIDKQQLRRRITG